MGLLNKISMRPNVSVELSSFAALTHQDLIRDWIQTSSYQEPSMIFPTEKETIEDLEREYGLIVPKRLHQLYRTFQGTSENVIWGHTATSFGRLIPLSEALKMMRTFDDNTVEVAAGEEDGELNLVEVVPLFGDGRDGVGWIARPSGYEVLLGLDHADGVTDIFSDLRAVLAASIECHRRGLLYSFETAFDDSNRDQIFAIVQGYCEAID